MIRSLLIRLILGADEMVTLFAMMLKMRNDAIETNRNNHDLEERLLIGQADLREYKAAYARMRVDLEKAYTLELT